MGNAFAILVLVGLAALPVLFSWLIVVLPSKRREASGLIVGNPLKAAPLAIVQPVLPQPLVAMSRQLSSTDMREFIVGMRHLPVERAAPLLTRYMRCDDPALQLYAQSLLAQGQERWQSQMTTLSRAPADDARSSAWLLEAGLVLASPTLSSAAERSGMLRELAALARQRLQACEPSPMLLATAVEVFLEAGLTAEARATLNQLHASSPLRQKLEPPVAHAQHLQRLA
jgi:hypothetical protein